MENVLNETFAVGSIGPFFYAPSQLHTSTLMVEGSIDLVYIDI